MSTTTDSKIRIQLEDFSVTDEIEAMKLQYNGIPDVAWPLIRYWVKDIRLCSPNVCKRRGYIV